MSFDEIRKSATPRTQTVKLLLDGELLDEHARADTQLREALAKSDALGHTDEIRDLARQVQELEDRIAAQEHEFTFRSIGTSNWKRLLAEHPPQQNQQDHDHNPLTFPPVALAASCVTPTMTIADAQWLMDNAPLSEWTKAWAACLDVNLGASDRPKSRTASVVLHTNGTSPGTAAPEGSLGASS